MGVINEETCRLAMKEDICCKWEVLNSVWEGTFPFNEKSPWGRDLKEMSRLAPCSEETSSISLEKMTCWIAWMSFYDPYPN